MIRTTITLPEELYEELRRAAFYEKKTVSAIIRERVVQTDKKKNQPGRGIMALAGIVKSKKGKNFKFDRKKFYDEIIKHKMSFGF